MTDNRPLDLVQALLHGRKASQKWKSGGVVAKEQKPVFGMNLREEPINHMRMVTRGFTPLVTFIGESFPFVDGHGEERGGHTHEHVPSEALCPEGLKLKLALG